MAEMIDETKHSPLPWRLLESKVPGYERYISVVHGDNLSICQLSGAGSYNPKVLERVRADAELIITAVNERERLREACRKALTCASLNSDVRAFIVSVLNGEKGGER